MPLLSTELALTRQGAVYELQAVSKEPFEAALVAELAQQVLPYSDSSVVIWDSTRSRDEAYRSRDCARIAEVRAL